MMMNLSQLFFNFNLRPYTKGGKGDKPRAKKQKTTAASEVRTSPSPSDFELTV
jgi:hypothetical protein